MKNLNAFDLVRLHRYPELVAKETDDMPMSERNSFKAMQLLAAEHPAVVLEAHAEVNEEIKEMRQEQQHTNGKDHNPSPPMLTFAEIKDGIDNIADGDRDACSSMIGRIAVARLSASDTSTLAGMLRNAYPDPKPPRKYIEKDIHLFNKQLIGESGVTSDEEELLLNHLLDELYEGGRTLKRIAKTYWAYRDGAWLMMDEERVEGGLRRLIVAIREQDTKDKDIVEIANIIEGHATSTWLMLLHRSLKAMLADREDGEDPLRLQRRFPLPVINTRNCELWFDMEGNMERREHNPDNFLTAQVACDYDPQAECPEWDRFCALIFNECSDPEDMKRHLEELGGYVISMSRWLKTWVLLKGGTDTGKSTFTTVLDVMLGNAFLSQDLGRFGDRSNQFTNTALVGKLALVDDDLAKRSVLPDGFLKTISEEKVISTEKKFGDVFRFVCRAVPIICSNHWPKTSDLSDAIRDRALVFPFNHKIAGSEKSDLRRAAMLEEMPGILNRFIAGIARLRQRGTWDYPQDCTEARSRWIANSNIIGLFASQCLVKAEGEQVHAKDAWEAFLGFSASEQISVHHRPGRNAFYKGLDSLVGARCPVHDGKLAYIGYTLVYDPYAEEIGELKDQQNITDPFAVSDDEWGEEL
jgi:P4 family phage/plasmid primase-like protien